MVISAIGRIAAKAAIKKISNASAKKARAAVKADLKRIDSKAIEAIKTAEGTKGSSKLFNKKMTAGILPAASGEKFIGSLSRKQLGTLSKSTSAGPLLSSKVKGQIKNALDLLKKPSRQKGGGMATRGMGAALKKGGMSKGKKYI